MCDLFCHTAAACMCRYIPPSSGCWRLNSQDATWCGRSRRRSRPKHVSLVWMPLWFCGRWVRADFFWVLRWTKKSGQPSGTDREPLGLTGFCVRDARVAKFEATIETCARDHRRKLVPITWGTATVRIPAAAQVGTCRVTLACLDRYVPPGIRV